jgi:anti-sigma factor RsiW
MGHPSEETLVAFVLELLPETQRDEVSTHLEACHVCEEAVKEYGEIAAALHLWHDAPPEAAAVGHKAIVQRVRLHRLLDRLFADAGLRRQAGQDAEAMLSTHGVIPTPQLVAAFKDLGLVSPERFPGELDERITKLQRLLEWFPGNPMGS